MKVMAYGSARRLSVSVGEGPESTTRCEGGSRLEERRAARGSLSDLRALGLPRAPESDFGGRASRLEQRPSVVECLTVCEMSHCVPGQASRVRSLVSPSSPISESC